MRRFTAVLAFGLLLLEAPVSRAAETAHPFTVHDLLAMDRIGSPKASPDGKRVVFVVRVTDLDANKGRNDLWLVDADGADLRRLTSHPSGDTDPFWHPDGRTVYFLSGRTESQQVWKIAADGGEAGPVTALPLDVNAFRISPDGKSLLLAVDVFPGLSIADTKKRLDEDAAKKASGRIYESLFVRHWDTWGDGRRTHLFVMPIDGKGEAVDIMPALDADCPTKPFGGIEDAVFTPDSRSVVFSARDAGREEAWSTNFDLFLAPADGSKPPVSITAANRAWDASPVFSPDGRTLARLAMSRPGFEADRFRLVLKAWPDGPERVLTEAWDRSPSEIFWSADGKTVFAAADHLGQHALFAVDSKTGAVKPVVKEGTVRSPQVCGGRLLYGLDHLKSPTELFTAGPDGRNAIKITDINRDKVAAAALGEPEQFSFAGWNGEKVYGYIVRPANFDPAKKYPVAFLIHGGPQGMFGNDFHYRWNPQTYAGAGYAAVMVDFHGSTGYGQAFTDAIRGDWGGKPLEDLQKGLKAALDANPWMDATRVGALGASYGGYMINWIAGAWPDRFRCLVSHDGNLDEKAAYFDTEELWFPEWEHGGTPWTNPEGYERHNPANLVKNWKTPMLVVHGGRDFRVVETQGLSSFTALQRLGIPSKLLYFPDENHWVLKPANSILWHETVLGWLDRWLKD
jgi:dipeptidyl aminopeptidase/acylaminoacyl peptidase